MDNTYREYLVSKKWASLKKAVHFFYEEECYICRSREKLHIHHKTYDRIYHEDLDDLVLVCWLCHSSIHDGRYTKEVAYDMLLMGTYKSKLQTDLDIFSELFPKINK